MREREESQNEAVRRIKELFPNTDTSKYFAKIEDDVAYVKIKGIRNKYYPIIRGENDPLLGKISKLPKTLRNALGDYVFYVMAENAAVNEKAEERIKELQEQRKTPFQRIMTG